MVYLKQRFMKQQFVYILSFAFILCISSCTKKELTRINTDPNSSAADNYDPNYLLSTTQLFYTGSSDNGAEVFATELGGVACFIQHMASVSGYFYGDKYLYNPGAWGSYYDHAYTSQVKFVVDLLNITKGKPQYANLYQIGRIMKALVFERLTDIYGDIPYFNAGLGYYTRTYSPAYDKQQDIYTDLLKEVEEATDSLDENADKPEGDLFYHGREDQIAAWKRFGNTLLLRMAMRLTKVDPEMAKAYVAKVEGNTMTDNDDNALVYHSEDNSTTTQNRVAIALLDPGVRYYGKWSRTYINYLKSRSDPRLGVVAMLPDGVTDADSMVGLPNGYDESLSPTTGITFTQGWRGSLNNYSEPSDIIVTYEAPTFVLTYSEAELLLADAAKRWGIGDVEEHYHNGVVAAITELAAYGDAAAIDEGDAEAFYTKHPYNDSSGLAQINFQFWASTSFNDYEAWFNWRRTGYPVLTPVNYQSNVTSGTIPRRMAYPFSERQSNAANYAAAVAASLPDGDNLTSRVWWDVP